MDKDTLIAAMDFSRARLLGILDAIEKSGQDVNKVLAWRPAPGRAHTAWQAMHCAATHDRYLHTGILNQPVKDEALVTNFAGGSTPSDALVPNLGIIRDKLATTYDAFKTFLASQSTEALSRKIMARDGKERSIADSVILLTWHEAHHQGQIHITWNMYKAAHGMV